VRVRRGHYQARRARPLAAQVPGMHDGGYAPGAHRQARRADGVIPDGPLAPLGWLFLAAAVLIALIGVYGAITDHRERP
jgi:hypothetical protein